MVYHPKKRIKIEWEINMELPNILRVELDRLAEGNKVARLKEASASLTEKYKNESGQGKRLVTTELEATAYSLVRMPATYGSVYSTLKYAFENIDDEIRSVLDVGAGTGACAWAITELLDDEIDITCLEREDAMIAVGKKLASENPLLNRIRWVKSDFVTANVSGAYDLVIASYALNELSDSDRSNIIKKLWAVTGKYLVIIEPGTPVGFNQLRQIRKTMLSEGANVVAPCPHNEECRLPSDDWCHFTCRVPRSKLHRLLKGAEAPYEDEKFAYLALSKEATVQASARILRHPLIEAGKITLKLCTKNGIISKAYTKKNGSLFKIARKSDCGDSFNE